MLLVEVTLLAYMKRTGRCHPPRSTVLEVLDAAVIKSRELLWTCDRAVALDRRIALQHLPTARIVSDALFSVSEYRCAREGCFGGQMTWSGDQLQFKPENVSYHLHRMPFIHISNIHSVFNALSLGTATPRMKRLEAGRLTTPFGNETLGGGRFICI